MGEVRTRISPFGADWLPGLQLYVGGAWLDVSADLSDAGLSIKRGREDENGQIGPASMSATLRNPTGRYSPRNPNSPLFGLIGRNTPVRSYVDLGSPWLHLEGTNARATCPDTAALSITGDLDIRWEGLRDRWSTDKVDLLSKYGVTGQRSWALQALSDGTLALFWSTDGTALLSAVSQVQLRASTRRIAVRATLDVDNGFGGYTVRFYTAPTLAGPWEQLGVVAAFTGSGTTSIFDSTAGVTIGKNGNTTAASATARVYGWEIRQGIDGTVRSSARTSTLGVGSTTFSDGVNTWTIASPAQSTNRHYRFYGEVARWNTDWTRKGAEGATADLECAGVQRRLGQGVSPLQSVMRRAILGIGPNRVAYWPMEDQQDSTSIAPGTADGRTMTVNGGPPNYASYDGIGGSAPFLTLQSARLRGVVNTYTSAGSLQVRWLGFIPTGTADQRILWTGALTGFAQTLEIRYLTQSSGSLQLALYDAGGALIDSFITAGLGITNKKCWFSVELVQNGSNVDVTISSYTPGESAAIIATSNVIGATSFGRLASVTVNPTNAALGDIAFGHLTVEKVITDLFSVTVAVLLGHAGEEADARVARLCAENGVPAVIVGAPATAEPMGPQGIDTLPRLLAEAPTVDLGLLYEPRDADGLAYRPLEALYSQHPALRVAYVDNLLRPIQPIEDDQSTRNLVTIVRDRGSSGTVEQTTGPLSTKRPEDGGVGIYDEELTLSLAADAQAVQQAGWRVHIGTHDEARWPVLGIDLADSFWLAYGDGTRDVLALDLGDRIDVSDLPPWLPPDDVRVLTEGYSEQIRPRSLQLEFNCTPERPYNALFWNSVQRWSGGDPGDPNARTTVSASLTTTATSFTVVPPTGVSWTHDDGDFPILVDGEVMTVTNVVGDVFTVTRSVNGVVRAHAAGVAVALYEPAYWAL